MNSKERMAAAMDLRVPDRVPVMCQMSIGHMLLGTGLAPADFWHSAQAFARGLAALRSLYGFDGILVSLHGHPPDWEKHVLKRESGPGGERIHWKNGDLTEYPADDLPLHRPAHRTTRPELAAFDPDRLPCPARDIPVSQGLRFPLDTEHLFDVFGLVAAAAGPDVSLHGEVTSPLDYFLDLFGFEQALFGLVEHPERSLAILERLTDGIVPLAAGMAALGLDAVKVSSPYAGAGFLSPDFYRRFVLPFESRIVAAARAGGARAYLHTCGDVHDRLELMAASGASGIECLDPPPLGRTELREAKCRVGGTLFIKGNIDPVRTLLMGRPADVRRDALSRIAAGGPGGYILSTACSIAPRTPRENVLVLGEAAASFRA